MNHSTIARTLARGIRLSAVAALLALLSGLLAGAQPAWATNYFVTNTNNSGSGSLRQAITDAKNNPGTDIITFAATTDGIPIFLSGAAGEDANASGDLDILDGGDLTIQGNGAAKTIIDGGRIDRVFHVCPGGGCTNTVTLNGVTIRNGIADYGGGILNEAGTTTVVGSTVSANTASGGGGITNYGTLNVQNGSTIGGAGAGNTAYVEGGGIFNAAGTLAVVGSTVSANGAKWGAGIYNLATLNVQNSTIGGASASNHANFGGGIYNTAGTTTMDDSTVSANTASDGAGIYNWATLNVTNSTIGGAGAGNQANNGGGIYNSFGITTVDGCTVSANTAGEGAGIYNIATLNVTNSTIGGAGAGNQANLGGGIYNETGGTTTVTGSTVSANTASPYGGGIYNKDTLNVLKGSTIGGTGAGNQANFGGGIFNAAGTTTVDGSNVRANMATNGGGIYNSGGTTTVTGSCIVGNSANSFFNNQPAQQIATGNWWGATTGPNTPGADTVGGNVNVSGYLTEPIPACGFYVYLPLVLK